MRKVFGIIGAVIGVVLLVGALVWSTVAVPRLVKFPLSTDITLHYSGSVLTFVNPSTGAQLATPTSVPLTVSRTIRAIPGQSTSSLAIVSEHFVVSYGGNKIVEDNKYVLDRKSMKNVKDGLAFTFAPSIPGASAGSYYITLPMNLEPGKTSLTIWKPETGTTYPLTVASGKPASLDGMAVSWFRGTLPMTPVAGYEKASLKARGFPMSISPTQVQAQLQSAGVSVSKLSTALLPVLTPAETAQVLGIMMKPVPLHYYAFGSGFLAAQNRTGALIDLSGITDGIAVAPDTAGLKSLAAILSRHTSVTGVPAALAALNKLAAAPPSPVYELHYSQTPSSVSDMVRTTNDQLRQISLATMWVPYGLVAVGGVLLIASLFVVFLRRTPPGGRGVVGAREFEERKSAA